MPDQGDLPQSCRPALEAQAALDHGTEAIGSHYEPRPDLASVSSLARRDAGDPATCPHEVVDPHAEAHTDAGALCFFKESRIEITTTHRPTFRCAAVVVGSEARPEGATVRRLDAPAP
jgi:hypothetical protein